MPRRIGYARSTPDEFDTREQLRELQVAGCTEFFEDLVLADVEDARRVWMAFIATLDEDDTLVVSRIERLARTLSELRDVLLTLDERKVHLHICHWDPAPTMEPGDLSEIVQRLVDFEHVNRRHLTRIGIEAARGEGRVGGRRPKLTPEQMRELQYQLREPGADPVEVGKRFGVSRATAFKYKYMPLPD